MVENGGRLSIKNPDTHRLPLAVADATGETLTHAVIGALRERHATIESRKTAASVDEILAIADHVSALIKGPYATTARLPTAKTGFQDEILRVSGASETHPAFLPS